MNALASLVEELTDFEMRTTGARLFDNQRVRHHSPRMKLWIGAELDADVADVFRETRKRVENAVNRVITTKTYDLPLTGWDCIAIIRGDEHFAERTHYSRAGREMDFRLRLDHAAFKLASSEKRDAMLFSMLRRSLGILAPHCPSEALQQLRDDLLSIQQHDLQTRKA